jgi:hypothetical protein
MRIKFVNETDPNSELFESWIVCMIRVQNGWYLFESFEAMRKWARGEYAKA